MVLATLLLVAATPPRYEAVDLHFSIQRPQKLFLNDAGIVAGTKLNENHRLVAFVYEKGRVTLIGQGTTSVEGLNARGEVVAQDDRNVYLWRDGRAKLIEHSRGGGQPSVAGIDAEGNVVGMTDRMSGVREIFTYPPKPAKSRIDDLANRFVPSVLSGAGRMAGYARVGRGIAHAAVLDGGKVVEIGSLAPQPDRMQVAAVNDHGEVTGEGSLGDHKSAPSTIHAFLWKDGKLTDLPVFTPNRYSGSRGFALNNHGQVVGYCSWLYGDPGTEMSTSAVLWQEGRIYDLNSLLAGKLDRRLEAAAAINDKGQILAVASLTNTGFVESEVYLLTPVR